MTEADQQRKADLEWAICSEPLLNESPAFSGEINWETPPAPPKSHRVGYHFESLVDFWLREIRKVKIEASGLQIQDGKRTLGELDLVFRDEDDILTHWEVAVKFYLHFPHENHTGSYYIGPNAGDTLERKYKRFIEHQLPLGLHHLPEIEQQSIFTRGRIFYHPNETERIPSPLLSSNHLRGSWYRSSETELLNHEARFAVLMKPYWLAMPVDLTKFDHSFESIKEFLRNHFETSNHPVLVAISTPSSLAIEPAFIVHEHWPELR